MHLNHNKRGCLHSSAFYFSLYEFELRYFHLHCSRNRDIWSVGEDLISGILFSVAPRVSVNRTDFGVMRGDPARLECVVEGSPRPELDWIGAAGLKLNLTHSYGKYISTYSSHW